MENIFLYGNYFIVFKIYFVPQAEYAFNNEYFGINVEYLVVFVFFKKISKELRSRRRLVRTNGQ